MHSDMGKTTVTPLHRKTMDYGQSFQDNGLWRRLLTRAQEGNLTNQHFFVVEVDQGCSHSSMFCILSLPPIFMEHHRKRLEERITLEGPDGHKWLTMLGLQLDSQYCLNIGWKEFAADFNLEITDQIVFLLFEDSHFLVQVFDAYNNCKGRVLASPERGGDPKVKTVSQAGMQQRTEARVAEKTRVAERPAVRVPPQRQGTQNPLLYFDTERVKLDSDHGTPRRVDANPALRTKYLPSVHCHSKLNGKDVIHLLASSEDSDDGLKLHLPLKPVSGDVVSMASTMRVGGSGIISKTRRRETIARCTNEARRVDAEDQMQDIPEDVSDCIKRLTPTQSSQLAEMEQLQSNITQKHAQSDEEQDEENGSVRDRNLGKHPPSRSPPSTVSAPSSPEHVAVMKRSTKRGSLQKKTRVYEGDDVDYVPRIDRLGRMLKLTEERAVMRENVSVPGVNAECNPVETPPVKWKRNGVASKLGSKVAESEILTEHSTKRQQRRVQETSSKVAEDAKIRAPENKKKKALEHLPKGMKRTPEIPLGQSAAEAALDAPPSVPDVEATGANVPQENGAEVAQSDAVPPEVPVGVGTRMPVKSRPKVKAYKSDRGEKKGAKSCPPPTAEEEPSPPPGGETQVVYKRPTKIARIGPAKVHNIIYISRRRLVTEQERVDTLAKAQEHAQRSINKHYVMRLRDTQVYCGYHLGVLPEFVEALQLPLVREKVTLFDNTGKTWEVIWQGDHPQKPGFNSQGWIKFVLDHCLEEGDVLVFELPDPKVFNISVANFPIVPLSKIPELGWKSHYGGAHTGEKSELPAQSHS